jgi:hypothetical protein
LSVFLLSSLFCCDIRNTSMVLFLMTYIWHFYVANKDEFTWSTTSNSLHALRMCRYQVRMLPHQHAVKHVIDPSNIERTLNRWLNSKICVSTRCMGKNESKFERNETLSDLFNSDAFCIATSFTVIHVVFSWYVILAVFSLGNLCIP